MISLSPLRELTLRLPFAAGQAAHLSAASGLVVAGEFLYVVADDEHLLGVFPRDGDAAGAGVRLLPGDLPLPHAPRKRQKPDFEVLIRLPAFDGYADGALLALGSGSRESRCRGVLLRLDAHGRLRGEEPRIIDTAPLYAELERRSAGLNIEGAVVVGDEFWLLQRGNARGSSNACVRLRLHDVLASLAAQRVLDAGLLLDVAAVTLGQVRGVSFGFTDATSLQDGNVLFCAVAEDTHDAYADGPCIAASIGLLDRDARLLWIQPVEPLRKLEGIAGWIDGDSIRFLAVTDADDESTPALLLAGEIPVTSKAGS